MQETSLTRSIPSLDGLRALAISLVLASHYGQAVLRDRMGPQDPTVARYLFELSHVGVSLFFVISGFLITFLLEKEKTATDAISLKAFYLRRAFRIFPPFYVYLLVVLILWGFGVSENWRSFLASATYTWNYYEHARGALLSSTWSLSLEEQFYLCWPLCLKWLKVGRARWLALWLIVLMPFSRLLTYVWFPSVHAAGRVSAMLHTRVDTIMFGCLLALCWRSERFKRLAEKVVTPWSFAVAALCAFVVFPVLTLYLGTGYRFGYLTISGIALTWSLIYVVRRPRSAAGRFLNTAPLRYVGIVSYSLYLYQQMFTGFLTHNLLLNLLGVSGATLLSYYLVERPSQHLRDAFLRRRLTAAP